MRRVKWAALAGGIAVIPFNLGQSCLPYTSSPSSFLFGGSSAPSVSITVNPGDYGYSAGQEILEGKTAILKATDNSYGGDSLNWQWEQVGGPAVDLRGVTTDSCSFVAPTVDQDTEITLRVTGSGDRGSSSDTVVVNVLDTATKIPGPVAEAHYLINSSEYLDYGTADADAQVTLSGAAHPQGFGSSDYSYYSNGQVIQDFVSYSYHWEQTAGPAVALSNSDIQSPSFVTPAMASISAATFRLTATDALGRTAAVEVSVNINAVPPPEANPQATYGYSYGSTTVSAPPRATVSLSNTAYSSVIVLGSKGPYSGLEFKWEQTAGPTVTIAESESKDARFEVPCVTALQKGTFQLTVTDRLGRSASATVDVNFTPNSPPSISTYGDQSFTDYYYQSRSPVRYVPSSIKLQGTASNGGGSLETAAPALLWEQLSGPVSVTIQDSTRDQAYFVVPEDGGGEPVYGEYLFRLTATDSCGLTATSLVKVTLAKVTYNY